MERWRDERGVNLLEVMTAMFMVALISSCLMGGLGMSDRILHLAGQQSRASSFAFRILEDLRARPAADWTDMRAAIEQKGELRLSVKGTEAGENGLQATILVDELQNIPALYRAKVTVSWAEAGRKQSLEMVTCIYPALRSGMQ